MTRVAFAVEAWPNDWEPPEHLGYRRTESEAVALRHWWAEKQFPRNIGADLRFALNVFDGQLRKVEISPVEVP
jgi:hypothetical protein